MEDSRLADDEFELDGSLGGNSLHLSMHSLGSRGAGLHLPWGVILRLSFPPLVLLLVLLVLLVGRPWLVSLYNINILSKHVHLCIPIKV